MHRDNVAEFRQVLAEDVVAMLAGSDVLVLATWQQDSWSAAPCGEYQSALVLLLSALIHTVSICKRQCQTQVADPNSCTF